MYVKLRGILLCSLYKRGKKNQKNNNIVEMF